MKQPPLLECIQIHFHGCGVPGSSAEFLSVGVHGDVDDGMVESLVVGIPARMFHMACGETDDHERIVKLAFGEAGFGTETYLVAEFETRGRVCVGRKSFVSLQDIP